MRLAGSWVLLLAAILLPSCGAPASRESAQRAEARAILLRAQDVAQTLDLQDRYVALVTRIGTAQVRAGDSGEALKTVRSLIPEAARDHPLRDVARRQAQMGDVTGAKRTAASIQDDIAQMSARVDIAAEQARAGDVASAFVTIASITGDVFTPFDRAQAFQRIAIEQHTAGKREDAQGTLLRAFQLIQTAYPPSLGQPEVITLVERLYALATDQIKLGDATGSAATLEHLRSVQRHHPDLKAIPRLTVDLVRLKLESGDVRSAHAAAASMTASEERDTAFQLIAARHARSRDIRAAVTLATRIHSREPRLAAFDSICMGQAGAGDVAGALETAKLLVDPRDRALVLITVAGNLDWPAHAPAAAALKQRALEAVSGLKPYDLHPDFAPHLAVLQARLADPVGAAATVKLIRRDQDRGEALANVLATLAASGDWRGALDTAQREPLPLLRAYALAGVAEGMLGPAGPLESLCTGLDNSFDCAQVIEHHQLAKPQYARLVTRTTEGLYLRLLNGQTQRVKQRDTPGDASAVLVTFRDHLDGIGYFLLHRQHYEGRDYVLVHARSGKEFELSGLPVVAPDRLRLVTISAGLSQGYGTNEVKIWRVKPNGLEEEYELQPDDWEPADPKWVDRHTIRLQKQAPLRGDARAYSKTVRLKLRKTWTLEE